MKNHGWKWLVPIIALMIAVFLAGCAAADPVQTRSGLENGDSEWTMYLGLMEFNDRAPGYSGAYSNSSFIQLRVWEDIWDANSTAIPHWSIWNYNQESGVAGPKYNFNFEEETWTNSRGAALVPKDFSVLDATTTGTNRYEITCVYKGTPYTSTEIVHFVKNAAYPTDLSMTIAPFDWDTKTIGTAEPVVNGELTFVKGQDYVLTLTYADNDPERTDMSQFMNWYETYPTSGSLSLYNVIDVPDRYSSDLLRDDGSMILQHNQLLFRVPETGRTGTYYLGASLSIGMSNLTAQKDYILNIVDPPRNWSWEYEQDEQTLILSGEGEVTLGGNETPPWFASYQNPVIRRIVINDGITGIGSGVFRGISGKVRIDFLQSSLVPEVDENAFGQNMTAVCRYYDYEEGDWPEGYIYMPHFNQYGALTYGPVSYKKGTNTGWSVEVLENGGEEKTLTPEAAHEVLIDSREMYLYGLPAGDAEKQVFSAVLQDVEADRWTLAFEEGFVGALSISDASYSGMPAGTYVMSSLPDELFVQTNNNSAITVHDTRTNGLSEMRVAEGNVTYTGTKIGHLKLEGTRTNQTGGVTVNGEIENLSYYAYQGEEQLTTPYASSFDGYLNVKGSITHGTVYAYARLRRGNSTDKMTELPFGPVYTFSGTFATQTRVISTADWRTNYGLKDVNGSSIYSLNVEDYELAYNFAYYGVIDGVQQYGNSLRLTPKEGTNVGVSDIMIDLRDDCDPSVSASIFWGDSTTVNLSYADNRVITLNGEVDDNGNELGLKTLDITGGCKVTVNCAVGHIGIQPDPGKREAIELTVNNQVNSLYIQQNNCTLTVTAGAGGRIGSGTYRPPLRDIRSFGPVTGSTAGRTVITDNTLQVMSWKNDGGIRAILPSDTAVANALDPDEYQGMQAMIDLTDMNPALTQEEKSAIAGELAVPEENIDGMIDKVFDLSVTTYTVDPEDGFREGSAVGQLDNPVTVQIADNGGSETVVARLHQGQDGPEAAVLANTAETGRVYQFETDRFSTYVLLKGEKGLTFRDTEGAVLNGTTQTGRYFYKVYIELPEGARVFETGYGDPSKAEPDGEWWRSVNDLPSDEYGPYFYVMPPMNGSSNALFARANSEDPWVKIVFEHDLSKLTKNTTSQPITNTVAPVVMEPYTVNWTAVTDSYSQPAEAYAISWANNGLGYFEQLMVYDGTETSFTIDNRSSEDYQMAVGMPGNYEIQLTALMTDGSAVEFNSVPFTVVSDYAWKHTLTYSPVSATAIEVPHNGVFTITVNNLLDDKGEDEALFYCAYILADESEPDGDWIANTGWVFSQEGSTQTVLRLPVAACTIGQTYQVHVFAGRFGADKKNAAETVPIIITEDDDSIGFIFTADLPYDETEEAYTVQAYQDFGLFLYKEGASRYELYCNGRKDGEWDGEAVAEGHYELDPGYFWLQAAAYVWDEDEDKEIRYESEGILIRVTAEGTSGIYANVPTEYSYDRHDEQPEPLSFTVTNLGEAEGEYWCFRLRRSNEEYEIWGAGIEYGDEIRPDTENGNVQTFIVEDINQQEPGQVYVLEMEAHVKGRRPFRESHTIIVKDSTEYYQNISLTVNGQPHSCADDVGKPAHIVIEAPGATALALFNGEHWNFLDDYDGSGYYERMDRFEENTRGYTARACYADPESYNNNPDYAPWTGFSNVVIVSSYMNGDTARPTVTLEVEGKDANGQVARGKTLTVVIGNPADLPMYTTYNATCFNVTIEDENGDRIGENTFTEGMKVPVRVGMSTGGLRPGELYKAVVDAQEIGKGWTRAESGWFTVTDVENYEAGLPTIDLVAEKDNNGVYHVKQGERAQVLGTAPNAARVDVFAHNTADGDQDEYDIHIGDAECHDEEPNPAFVFNRMDEVFNRLDAGTYELYAVATYVAEGDPGWTTESSNRLTVKVEMADDNPQNRLARPVISLLNNDAVIAPDDLNDPSDCLAFQVTNLEQTNVNYWEVRVEDDLGDLVFRRTNSGWTEIDNHNVARFSINKKNLMEGMKYRISAKVCGIGYRQQEDFAYVMVTTRNTSSRVTVNASKRQLKIGEPFTIHLSMYTDVTAVMIDMGDGNWESYAVKDRALLLNQFGYSVGSEDTLDYQYDSVGTRAIKVMYSKDTNVPWMQAGFNGTLDWSLFSWFDVTWEEGIVSAVTVNVTSDGDLPDPDCSISATEDLVQGDILTVTIGADPVVYGLSEDDFWYYAEVLAPVNEWDGLGWQMISETLHFDWLPSTRQIFVPMYGLPEGKYRIRVGICAEGYQDGHRSFDIWIGKNDEVSDIEFSVSNNSPQAGEEIGLILCAKYACWTAVDITKEDDPEWLDTRSDMRDLSIWSWSARDEGTYTFTPCAWYPSDDPNEEPQGPVYGTPVTVTVTACGTLNEPEITADSMVKEGNGLTVHVKATGTIPATDETAAQTVFAEEVELRLIQKSEGYENEIACEWIELDENGEGSFFFNEDQFYAGNIYEIEANSCKTGWNSGNARKRVVAVSGDINPKKKVSLTINGSTASPREFPSGESMTVRAQAAGAYAVRILLDDQWRFGWGELDENDWSFGKSKFTMIAMASYDNPETLAGFNKPYNQFTDDDWTRFSWDEDVSWTGLSNAIDLEITSNGALGTPTYTVSGLDNNNHIMRGGMLTVTLDNDPVGTPEDHWYYAEADRKETNPDDSNEFWWYPDRNLNWGWNGPNDRTISISTMGLDAGEYRLRVGIDAVGWDGTEAETQVVFTVDNPEGTDFLTDIPESVLVNSDQQYHALKISGAQEIEMELLHENQDSQYEVCMERESLHLEWNGIATYGLYVFDTGNYKALFYADGSETPYEVEFEATAIGTLPLPRITMNGLWRSGNLKFTVQTEDGVYMDVGISDGTAGEDDLFFSEQWEYNLDAGHFADDKDYLIWVNQRKEGFTGGCAGFRVRRTTKYKTLTLPAGVTTIEAEAFAGVAAELIIIPDGVTRIEAGTFADCHHLQAVIIPESVTYIDPNAFTNENNETVEGIMVYGTAGSAAETFADGKTGLNWAFIRIANGN